MYEVTVKCVVTQDEMDSMIKAAKRADKKSVADYLIDHYVENEGVESCEVEIKDLRFKDEIRN